MRFGQGICGRRAGTSIGFGEGDVIQVSASIRRMRRRIERALPRRRLLQLKDRNGEAMVINPMQVKILQSIPRASRR